MDNAELEAHVRRLEKLKLQAAYKGINTSPEILMEIEDIESKIRTLLDVGNTEKASISTSPYFVDMSLPWFGKIPDATGSQLSQGRIMMPIPEEKIFGRYCTVMGKFARIERRSYHWIAVSPDQAYGLWWPQNEPLEMNSKGAWVAEDICLGRDFPDGQQDIGRLFEIGLYQVTSIAAESFSESAKRGQGFTVPQGAYLLHKIVVTRQA